MSINSYSALKRKLLFTTLGLSIIPLFVLGYIIHSEFSQSYEEKLAGNLSLVVGNKRDSIDMFLNERVMQLQMLADMHTFSEITDPSKLNSLFEIVQRTSHYYIDLGVIGQNGEHEAYCGPFALQGVNYKNAPWFNQVMRKGFYISDVFMGFRNFPHFIIAVKRREAGKAWILRATIDPDIFTSLVRNVRTGKLGDAYLVNSECALQTPSRFGDKVLSKTRLPDFGDGSGVEIFHWGREGTEFMAGMTPLSMTGWRLVILEDPIEELTPLLRTRSLIYALLAACALMIFAGAYFTTASVISRLQAADREQAAMDAAMMQSSKMASLGKMAAGVAHEINNPLSIIRESAGWIRDMINDGEMDGIAAADDLQEAVGDIERHVERARTVTHRMLGFARRMEPRQENVDLNLLARQTVAFLENETLHRNIHVECELEQNLPFISTDANQIQQVILNLLENAIDAIGENGCITIVTRMNGSQVFMDIHDSGEGIASEHLSKVFDPFFTTKSTGRGTGLGLSIVYSTLKKLGGDINVESEYGDGTTFSFRLPAEPFVHKEESWPE